MRMGNVHHHFVNKSTDLNRLTCNVKELRDRLSLYGIDIRDIHNDEITTVLSYINSKHDRIIMRWSILWWCR